ncbi:HTH-type transcriptional regulator MalT [Photobacterium kishitanii]|uniref:HTH-type transcriptional regulator MalT n=1 Tax=Photobacterium kishitanii TaxID=318456 RepID=UPI00071AEE1E|nr:HTH-type transcriptional regulator MalT [Photobacterium kishitanii]
MWIPSKLTRPARLHNAILRPRILEALTQASYYRLVLFRSPAGYGKTTMAAQWLKDIPHTGWFNIDDNDNETFRFVNYFLQAVNKATDNSCLKTQAMAERRQFACITTLMNALFAELSNYQETCYIVLDDYHVIDNDDIHEGMRFFLKHMPDNITLVVTSRIMPPLGTANLRIRDLLLEIDNTGLAFDDEETQRFFHQRISENIESELLSTLRKQVEGWPSALQLIALHAKQKTHSLANSTQSIAAFNRSHLWDYLAEEVFDQLSDDTKDFLLHCSILDMFNAELITELTARSDALSMLESLDRFGLFLTQLEGEDNWYRFHHLFAEFLRHQRYTTIPQQRNELHCNAAKAWLKQGNFQQALVHTLKSENQDLITDILCDHGWNMFHQGELKLLEYAIEQLDQDALFCSPRLCLLRAWLAQSQHRYNNVGELLAQSEAELALRKLTIDDAIQGEFNALRAQVAINQSKPQEALALAELSLGQLPATTYRSRIVATSVIGEVHHCLGNLNQALSMMQQTEKMARQYHVYHQALWALLQQSEILVAQGAIHAAFELLDQALKLIKEQHLQQVPLHEFTLRLKAQILWCWHRLEEAEQCAHQCLEILAPFDKSQSLHAYSMLARIAVSRGELDKATRYLDICNDLVKNTIYHIDWLANYDFSQLLYWQAKNDLDAIQYWLSTVTLPITYCNHFQQLHARNIVRSHLLLQNLDEAQQLLNTIQQHCIEHSLHTDQHRNTVVQAVLYKLSEQPQQALDTLKEVLTISNHSGMISNFLCEGETISGLLHTLIEQKQLDELTLHRSQYLLREMTSKQRARVVHFDETFVDKLLALPNIPELIRSSPLTQREWQVLGLIYAGYSNEQISNELDVAATTIKTHIRNLYQKLNITNRRQAIETAESLLKLIGLAA